MSNHTVVNSKRIAKNTILLYVRMLITMMVSLYTSRIVLEVLGVDDFGIYNVVGGIVVVLSFLNNSMTTSTQRFLNFELGTNNKDGLKQIFSTAVLLHLIIGALIIILALTVGAYFLEHQMNISSARKTAAWYVFVFSVLTFVFQTITVPYNSVIIAHEKMSAYAYLSIIEVFLKLLIVYLIRVIGGDHLITYALLSFVVIVLIRVAYIIYSKRHFEEAVFAYEYIDKQKFKQMFSFSSWSIVGNLGYILHTQGMSIVTNIYFNTAINAAQGIANQVNSAVTSFTTNFQVALNPQIVKSYAAKEIESMHQLIFRGCKFSYFLVLIFTIPIIVEAPQILNIWLTTIPPETVEFVRLILIVTLINSFSNIMSVAQGATGKVKTYQIVLTSLGLLHIPFAMLFFELGFPAYYGTVVYIFLSLVLMTTRVLFVTKSIELKLSKFVKQVCVPTMLVTIISFLISILIHRALPATTLGFISSCVLSVICVIVIICFIGLNKGERVFLYTQCLKLIRKS